MKKKIFDKKTNDTVLYCWLILTIVLLVSYTRKCFSGDVDYIHLIFFCLISFIPMIAIYIINKTRKEVRERLKYFIAAGYILFYTFVMVTLKDSVSFVYIIPIIATLVVYNDKLLIGIMCFYAVFLNFAYVIVSYGYGYDSVENMNMYYAQIVSILLSGIFLYRATEILKMHNDKLYELSEIIIKDPLTDAYNRKFINDNFDEFVSLSNKNGLSLAVLDIDDFKMFNTKYGHDFGDIVLKTFSSIIIKILRKYNDMYFIRLGGDEFAIIAVEANYDKFVTLLENIRVVISSYNLKNDDEDVNISISLGVVNSKKAKSKKFETLYKKADVKLYQAKEKGKNIVIK